MFARSRLMFFCLALPLLTQCLEAEKPKHVYTFNFDNEQQAQQVLSSLSVSCESPGSCPEASGGLFFIETTKTYYSTSYSGGTCSQTLIAPNKVLTNRHCLPSNALSKGSGCANITVFFPASLNKPAEKIVCKSVVDLSAAYTVNDATHPDWAVLELASDSTRTPIQVDTSGLPKDTAVTAYPVYYTRSQLYSSGQTTTFSITGKIKKISCESKMNTRVSTYYNHATNPLVALICDNDVIHGNSGTGVFGADQRLLAVISMAVDTDSESMPFMGKNISLDNKFAGGTNAHCIEYLNGHVSEACAFDEKNEDRAFLGDWLGFIFAQEVQSSEKEKFETLLSQESLVHWEDSNIHFLQSIYQSVHFDRVANVMTPAVAESILQYDLQTRFPKTPRCISAVMRSRNSFVFYMPGLYSNFIDFQMLPSMLIIAPLKISKLSFIVRYDPANDIFKARLQRLQDDKRVQFFALKDEISSKFNDCYSSKYSFSCLDFFTAGRKLDRFFDPSTTDANLYFNEDFIDGNTFGTNEVSIPVCDDRR